MENQKKDFDTYFKESLIDFMTEHWGERCPDHEDSCPICQAWDNFDTMFESLNPTPLVYAYKTRLLEMSDVKELEKEAALGWHLCAAAYIPNTVAKLNTVFYFRKKL